MKILIISDLEGTAGVFSRDATRADHYQQARRLGSYEVSAAISGLKEAGVDDIIVEVAHDLDVELLPSGIRVVKGRPMPSIFGVGLDKDVDGVLITGMHAMAGGKEKGCWRHSLAPHPITLAFSSVCCVWLNNTPVGEIGIIAAVAGTYGIPVLMVSGDYWACEEGRELLGNIETAAVKRGISYQCANSMQPKDACALVKSKAKISLDKIGKVKPYKIDGEVELRVKYFFSQKADELEKAEGIVRIDKNTLAMKFKNISQMQGSLRTLRAKDNELERKDLGLDTTEGLFYRTGPEPYVSGKEKDNGKISD